MEYINNGTLIDNEELLFNELYEKTKDCGRVQFINLLMAKERDNQELKKKLGEQQYYKFYKYDNNPDGSDYCYCERPCDDNMSLRCFLENGEILGFMSETLVSAYDNIKEITMSDFMFEFVKPLIKENYIMRTQQQEFIEWLEKEISKHEERQGKLLSSLENELNEGRSKDDLWLMGYYDATKDILEEVGELYGEE